MTLRLYSSLFLFAAVAAACSPQLNRNSAASSVFSPQPTKNQTAIGAIGAVALSGTAFADNCPALADCKVTRAFGVFTIGLRLNVMKRIEGLVLPIVLLLTGLILIGGDRAGVLSLDRIENLWPMALILVGLSDFLTTNDEKENSGGERRRV